MFSNPISSPSKPFVCFVAFHFIYHCRSQKRCSTDSRSNFECTLSIVYLPFYNKNERNKRKRQQKREKSGEKKRRKREPTAQDVSPQRSRSELNGKPKNVMCIWYGDAFYFYIFIYSRIAIFCIPFSFYILFEFCVQFI